MMTMMVMMIWSVVNLRQYGIHKISGGSASQCSLAKYARSLLSMLCFFLSYRLFMGIVVLVVTHYWNDLFKISYFIKVSARLKLRAHYWSKMGWPVVQMPLPPPISLVLHKKIEQPNLMRKGWRFVQNINSAGKQKQICRQFVFIKSSLVRTHLLKSVSDGHCENCELVHQGSRVEYWWAQNSKDDHHHHVSRMILKLHVKGNPLRIYMCVWEA